ncbi:MAG: hypothetical protein IKW71_00640 [Elusimicrobiaceae bacterium]|nr:hypothetical protein [Elusimicrobiaceae bacterium]
MKIKILSMLLVTGLVSGCMATITPSGEVYTEALLAPAVVVESYPQPIFVSAPARHHPRPMGPIATGHRYNRHTPARPAHHGSSHRPQGTGHHRR